MGFYICRKYHGVFYKTDDWNYGRTHTVRPYDLNIRKLKPIIIIFVQYILLQ